MIDQCPSMLGDPAIIFAFANCRWFHGVFQLLKCLFQVGALFNAWELDGVVSSSFLIQREPSSRSRVELCNDCTVVGVMVPRPPECNISKNLAVPALGQDVIRLGANPSSPASHAPCPASPRQLSTLPPKITAHVPEL